MSAELNIPKEFAETIVDPKAYAEENQLQDVFTKLRADNPLGIAHANGFDPFWAVTKFDDIQHVEKNNELFHNGDVATVLTNIDADKAVREMMGGSPHLVRSLVQMDNPDHRNYRMLTQNWFMPQNIKKLEVRIREIARTFVDRMADYGNECDFARDVAFLYPLHVIMEILGVPESDEPRMLKLTQELFGAADPDLNRTGEVTKDSDVGVGSIAETVAEFMEYFNAITEDRRANPTEDLSSAIANGTINDEPLDHFAAMSYYIIAATAGHDTTSATTSGGMWALCENQDQLAKVKADPKLIPGLTEESIRWVTPVKHFMRSATADTELRGRKISKGDWLMLCYSSGNRDEEKFDDPFKFNVERMPNKHVAMGYGAHVCLGQHLARMEMNIFFEELFARLDSIELAGTPKRMEANFVCGPKSIPVRFKMN